MKRYVIVLLATIIIMSGCGTTENNIAVEDTDIAMTETEESEEYSEDIQDDAERLDWISLYYEYVSGLREGIFASMGLVYINDDEIPELVIDYSTYSTGATILTIIDNKVVENYMYGGSFYYSEKGNVVNNHHGKMGEYSDRYIGIGSDGWVEYGIGEYRQLESPPYILDRVYDDKLCEYRWNGRLVKARDYMEECDSIEKDHELSKWVGGTDYDSMEAFFTGHSGEDWTNDFYRLIKKYYRGLEYNYAILPDVQGQPYLLIRSSGELEYIYTWDDGIITQAPDVKYCNNVMLSEDGYLIYEMKVGDENYTESYRIRSGSVTSGYDIYISDKRWVLKDNLNALRESEDINYISYDKLIGWLSGKPDEDDMETNTDERAELVRYMKLFEEYDDYMAVESDLYVEYKGFTITPETKVIELFEALGYPKRLNEQGFGYYNSSPEKGYQWCLQYPDLDTMDSVRRSYFYIVVKCEDGYHDETVDDRMDGIIQFIHLNCHPTKKGLKVGDKIDDVARLYGKPDNMRIDDGYIYLTYIVGDSDIWIAVNKNSEIVRSIYLEYLKDSSDKFVYERDRAVSAELVE